LQFRLISRDSVVHVADLAVHVVDAFFEGVEFFAEGVLVLAEVVGVLLDALEEGLVVVDGLVDGFLVADQVLFVDLAQVVQVPVDALVGLLILEFDVVEELQVGRDLLVDRPEVALQTFDSGPDVLSLRLLHLINQCTVTPPNKQ
jgi:hypothetical protein